MRIDPKTVTSITSYKARDQAPASAKPTTDASRSSVVSLSTAAGAAASATATSEHKTAISRVETIRAAIARGDYPVDLDKLATSIVDDEHNPRGGTA